MNSDDFNAIAAEANAMLEENGYRGMPLTRAHVRAVYLAMQQLELGAATPQRTITRQYTETIQEPVGLIQRVRLLIGGGE